MLQDTSGPAADLRTLMKAILYVDRSGIPGATCGAMSSSVPPPRRPSRSGSARGSLSDPAVDVLALAPGPADEGGQITQDHLADLCADDLAVPAKNSTMMLTPASCRTAHDRDRPDSFPTAARASWFTGRFSTVAVSPSVARPLTTCDTRAAPAHPSGRPWAIKVGWSWAVLAALGATVGQPLRVGDRGQPC